jgi:transmembrane sensor
MEVANIIRVLIDKRMKEMALTGSEEKQLTDWLNESPANQTLYDSFMNPVSLQQSLQDYHAIITSTTIPSVDTIISEPATIVPLPVVKRKRYWLVAASLTLLISVSGYLYFSNRTDDKPTAGIVTIPTQSMETPGGNKALLTLADGSRIVLDNAQNGAIAYQSGISVQKKQDGQLIYVASQQSPGSPSYATNTISTPRGGQYEVRLPDGTSVWLNAASSITFPIAFSDKDRTVTISGEAYFEVAKNAAKPFIVKIAGAHGKDASITVLGTHFNVNAYPEEAGIVTTLLEGSVEVTKGANSSRLKPGQAANINEQGALKVIKQVNTDQAIAWKNGSFVFAHQDIATIMRAIGRWYDVDIKIKGGASSDTYYGEISRSKQLRDVLHMLEQYEIGFELDTNKRRIIVKP